MQLVFPTLEGTTVTLFLVGSAVYAAVFGGGLCWLNVRAVRDSRRSRGL